MKVWLYLAIAIVAEVIATSSLKYSEGFSKPLPTLAVAAGYATSFFLLSLILKTLPVSITYAIWSGAGVALVTLVGWFWLGQKLDLGALIGIGLIVLGVVVINLFSNTVSNH
ncbi:multidrug efflux SMR transporter [Zoogloea sp.]|uniref:DMT family transporter n=1 Tax=Zoogloea sp. TaxID=49181 RepID=UPI001416A85D|nr:MAG: multidrug efflux SMR transporter [Zoogloea sp.]